jgi:hypothetical protein
VAAKDELLALMLDAATGPPPDPPAPDEGWRAGLSRWARAERAILLQNPWALHIPITGPPSTPNQIAWLEQGLRCLHDTGLHEGEKIEVIILLSGFVWREATLVSDMSAAALAAGGTPMSIAAYGRALAKLTDAERFPALHAVLASGVFEEPDDVDAEFVFGLDRILDGIGVLVRSKALRTPKAGRRGRRPAS